MADGKPKNTPVKAGSNFLKTWPKDQMFGPHLENQLLLYLPNSRVLINKEREKEFYGDDDEEEPIIELPEELEID